jgi:hypothetical protein
LIVNVHLNGANTELERRDTAETTLSFRSLVPLHQPSSLDMFRRALSTSRRVCDQASGNSSTSNSTAHLARTTLRRTKDPLMSSSQATHYTLPSGSQFIVRPPPSVLPASHPLPVDGSPTPTPMDQEFEHMLPASRQPRTLAQDAVHLNESQIAELQSLRRSDPATWTRQALATKFGISQQIVGRLGWGQGSEARRAEKEYQLKLQQSRQDKESRWGWKKAVAREERRRRRSMW